MITTLSEFQNIAKQHCIPFVRQYANNYHQSIMLMPKRYRYPVAALYAFLRLADEFVDSKDFVDSQNILEDLKAFESDYCAEKPQHPVIQAFHYVEKKYQFEEHWIQDFLESMKKDQGDDSYHYQTYTELEKYMWGSAGVVGCMMARIGGITDTLDSPAMKSAIALGNAMQLANFLRDVKEDIEERKRIYLPQEILENFECEFSFEKSRDSHELRNAVSYLIKKCNEYFQEARNGLGRLPKSLRIPTTASLLNYETICRNIEKSGYDVLRNNNTNRLQKTVSIIKAFIIA